MNMRLFSKMVVRYSLAGIGIGILPLLLHPLLAAINRNQWTISPEYAYEPIQKGQGELSTQLGI